MRHYSLAVSLALLTLLGCDRSQPLEPIMQARSTGGGASTVNAPTNTNAVAVSESRIDVSWQDNSPNETGFEVQRSTAGAAFALLASTGAGVISYSDVGLTPSTQYCYNVRAFRATGSGTSYSQFSPPACATTLASEPPAAPTLWAADAYPGFVQLWWFEDSDNEDGFRVERCAGVACGDPDFTVIAMGATNGTRDHFFQDWGAVPGTTYTYRIRAFNSAGDSAPSNQLSATACFVGVSEDGWYLCIG